ncbi:hypothetical protein PO124_18720 [Bacillus licheniformis]|nr:hypothetical protein [Bacillus licheniformis]
MDGEDIEPLEWDAMENPFAQIVPVSIKDGCIQVPDKSKLIQSSRSVCVGWLVLHLISVHPKM